MNTIENWRKIMTKSEYQKRHLKVVKYIHQEYGKDFHFNKTKSGSLLIQLSLTTDTRLTAKGQMMSNTKKLNQERFTKRIKGIF